MNVLNRWLRFNTVGVLGIAVQFSTLSALHRLAPHHLLACTLTSVEITLLHNFLWHTHFTWRDVRGNGHWRQFLRFHLGNGSISLVGNGLLTPFLALYLSFPLVLANASAVVLCSLANFIASHRWAFAASHQAEPSQ